MNKDEIIKLLEQNSLSSIEQIDYKKEGFVVRFSFEFDEDEVAAARAYANDECEEEEDSEEWNEEYFLPYLNDLAVDNVGETIEEIMETLDIEAQFVSYEMDEEEYSCSEFIAVFFEKGKNLDIEQILEDLEL